MNNIVKRAHVPERMLIMYDVFYGLLMCKCNQGVTRRAM